MADEIIKMNTPIDSATPTPDPIMETPDDDDPFADVKRELASRYELLPDELKKVIMSDELKMTLFTIAKEKKMTYEELGSLELETAMVLLGMRRPEKFRDELQLELKKNDDEIDALVKTVNEQVFAPVRAQLEKVYAAKKEPIDYLKGDAIDSSVDEGAEMTDDEYYNSQDLEPKTPETPGITNNEKTVLEKSGVVLSETPAPIKPATPSVMPERSDLISGIENPVRTPRPSIMEGKLGGVAPITQSKVTDYSLPKTTPPGGTTPAQTPSSSAPKTDPYRERIN